MPTKQRKITKILMQCSKLRCDWIGKVGDCVPDARIAADVPINLLIEKKYEGLLKCPMCGAIVNQISKG